MSSSLNPSSDSSFSGGAIHPTAIVHPAAVVGEGTKIGPYSVIGPKVKLGKRNSIASHVVIEGNTIIGDENEIFQFASVGAKPQDLKFHGEDSLLEIGNKNIVREYVTLQPGTAGGGMRTTIGNGNLFMASVHVGHDGKVGNGNIFANCATLAGHVTVGDGVTVGGLSGIHQFVNLGSLSFLGGGSMVTHDIPPFCIAQGDRAKLVGLNKIGLQRKGFVDADIRELQQTFRAVFLKGGDTLSSRVEKLSSTVQSEAAKLFLDFIRHAERGVAPVRRARGDSEGQE